MKSLIALLSFVTIDTAGTIKRQSTPVAPDTDPDCSYYDNVCSEDANFQYFEDYWGISHDTFVAWVR